MATEFRGFMGASLDGFVADSAGGVGWMKPFEDVDYGYGKFIDGIATVVLGRATYQQIPSFGLGWPYVGKPGFVLSSTDDLPRYDGVAVWHDGLNALIQKLRDEDRGDVWVVGGPSLQADFIAADALDRLDLFVLPVSSARGCRSFRRARRAGGRSSSRRSRRSTAAWPVSPTGSACSGLRPRRLTSAASVAGRRGRATRPT